MDSNKKIVWLASYPKSGNTWFRVFLANLLSDSDTPADINNLNLSSIASSRMLFDEAAGMPSSDLSFEEIDILRPKVYRYEAQNSENTIYHKIHDAWKILPSGEPLIPSDVTRSVVYFIRNPLDVAISFAHHSSVSIDRSIDMMNDPGYAFCSHDDRLHNQMRQCLFTWGGHVESWVNNSKLPLIVMRYEDMINNTFAEFKKAVTYLDLNYTDEKINKAIEFSSFENLKKQENEKGFREKAIKSESFFRKGKAGDWKNVLSEKQIKRIVKAHRTVMEKYGYADEF